MSETDFDKRLRDLEVLIVELRTSMRAHRKLTKEQFAAAKEAIVKAETAQADYNRLHNDLVRKNELMMTRQSFEDETTHMEGKILSTKTDINKDVAEIRQDIRSLRESRSESGGKGAGQTAAWGYFVAGMAVIGGILTIAVKLRGL